MKTEKTYNELQKFDAVAVGYLTKTGHFKSGDIVDGKAIPAHYTDAPPTPMSVAIKSVFQKQMTRIFEELNDEIKTIEEVNAATDPIKKTLLIVSPENLRHNINAQYEYTAAGKKAMRDQKKILFETKVIIHARIVPGWEELGLTEEEKEAFSGIVIPEQPKEKEEDEPTE